ncbi:MAG: anti-sigma factor family protein [Pyrinomonadaceae bacterium]
MSNNNNHNHSSCRFAEQMISYLYGEANQFETAEFESHLKNCFSCADELKGFRTIRSSVLEWREEFSNIETPPIAIPQMKTTVVSNDLRSRLAGLRKIFSFNPALAAAAFAALIVCGGLILFALDFYKTNELAKIDKNDSALAVASPTVEKTVEAKEIIKPEIASDKASITPIVASKNTKAETISAKRIAPKNTVAKISGGASNGNKNVVVPDNEMAVVNKNYEKSSVKKSHAPTLAAVEEEEDNSVRLTDLFAELDDK